MAKDTINIIGKEWQLTVTRNMSFWHQVLSSYGHLGNGKCFSPDLDYHLKDLIISISSTNTSILRETGNYREYCRRVMLSVNTREKVSALKVKYRFLADNLLNSLKRCHGSLTQENWKAFMECYSQYTPGLMLTATLGRTGSEELTILLQKRGYSGREIAKLVPVITYPAEHTPLFSSQYDCMKIAAAIREDVSKGTVERMKAKWLKKYQHIPVNFCEEPWNIDELNKNINDYMAIDCKKEMATLDRDHQKNVKATSKALKKIGDEKISTLAYALSEGTYLNEFRKAVFSKVSMDIMPVLKIIAEMCGSGNWRDCYYLTPAETINVLAGRKIDLKAIKKKRRVVAAYIDDNRELQFLNAEDSDKLYSYIAGLHGMNEGNRLNAGQDYVKGITANKGKVVGPAKIILSREDFGKLKRGDVLITTMTSVDFIPIMEKAGAFVTNEGGITSHASIVSREMDKPCVISTRIATSVFNNGDLIEVDADKGIVRRIRK